MLKYIAVLAFLPQILGNEECCCPEHKDADVECADTDPGCSMAVILHNIEADKCDCALPENQAGGANCEGGPDDRSLFSSQWYNVHQIKDYGCWCVFAPEKINLAYGKPLDEIDNLCMLLNDAYKCVKEHTEAEVPGATCNPSTQSFNVDANDVDPLFFPLDWQERLYDACQHTDLCRMRTCIIETNFVMQFYPLRDAGMIDTERYHDAGFEYEIKCMVRRYSGRETAGHMCCAGAGTIDPLYKVRQNHMFDSTWECCGNKSFDPATNQCCDDDESLIC
jgi:hypothetical protein